VAAAIAKQRRGRARRSPARGLLLSSSRPLPKELTAILASHALIHTAEGEMYRDVLRSGCEKAGVEGRRHARARPPGERRPAL
jgi:hypothetical protein